MLTPLPLTLRALLAVLVTVAAVTDFRTRRIPNALVLAATLIAFAAQYALFRIPGLRTAALGFGLGFVLYFPLWLLHARGAGDVKLLAAAGAFLGPSNTLVLFCVAAILGGIMALALVLVKNRAVETAGNIARILSDLLRFRRPQLDVRDPGRLRLPHAPVLALAAWAILFYISQTHSPSR